MTAADLDSLVVPGGSIAGLPLGFVVTSDSGWKNNQAEAENSIDPGDSAASLRAAGRIAGYELVYSDPRRLAARSGRGVETVLTWVELFRSADAASTYLKKRNEYSRGLTGKSPREGISFGGVTSFTVRMADEAYGLHEAAVFGGERIHRTLVSFRRGRVLAGSMYMRVDDPDVTAAALRLAGTLDTRIQDALMGGIKAEPVLIPKNGVPPDGQEPTAERPAGAPDLAALVLRPADFAQGVASTPGEYTRTTSPRITFRRFFFLRGAAIGRSSIVQVASEVSAFDSKAAASASLGLSALGLASPDGAARFATNLAATSGLQATHIRGRKVPLKGGDAGYLTSFDTSVGRLVDLYLMAQRGRGLAILEVLGVARGFDYRDLLPLLDTSAQRVSAELG